jgi:hypothetical protein
VPRQPVDRWGQLSYLIGHRRAAAFAVGAAGVLTAACYAYAPLEPPAPAPAVGQEVRVTLSVPTSIQLGEVTLQAVDRVEGMVQRVTADSFIVSGDWVFTPLGSRYAAGGGALLLQRPALRSLEVRRFSPARTGVAAVLAAGTMALLFAGIQHALGGAGPEPPPGQGN